MSGETEMFNDVFSIMAVQKQKEADAQIKESDNAFVRALRKLIRPDFSGEAWYVKGFEDYDTADYFVDIPLTETSEGYLPQLPDKTWDTILDCKVAAYLETEEGMMYIGEEHFSDTDADGHPLVSMDGIWTMINGQVVCYETLDPVVTDEGTVYRGEVKAKLNGIEDIILHIEWDPVTEDSDEEVVGHVTGYSKVNEKESFFMKKGLEQFETGDTVEFVFDFYDEEGNLTKTGTYGNKLHVVTDERMTVKDEMLESGTVVQYFGVLTDVYQRELMTEEIKEQVQ
jgi:hypothetical protein